MPDPHSLTDRLALQRAHLANEHTFLTYVRTSLTIPGFGLVLLHLHPARTGWLGYAALLAAAIVLYIDFFRLY